MARRTKEEAQQTRCHIMSTALDLFCSQGLAKTSLTDIARAADLTRGAIYWHFK
ncbi:MAG: TetR family transcriptional regulator, partial [Aeromonas veronii]